MAESNIDYQWDENAQKWYRMHYNPYTAQWVFLDWVERRDSGTHPHASPSNAGPALPRVGNWVQGTYSLQQPVADTHYEALDPSYFVRDGSYFQEGKMFAVLFTEAAGTTAMNAVTDYNTALSRVLYNEVAHTQVRRFIIVRRKREFCYAVPIFTYSGLGTKKHGVVPEEHAIAYSYGRSPTLIQGEQQLTKRPICIVMSQGERDLSQTSRIYFGIHHPIQYNVKVKDLGYVHQECMAYFLGYWNMENGTDTRQAADVTYQAV